MLRSFDAALLDCTTGMARAVELTDLNSTSRGEARVLSLLEPQDIQGQCIWRFIGRAMARPN